MKGWRGRCRIPPKYEKARFSWLSRGLSPQVLVLRVLSVAVSANIWYNTAIDKKEKP